MTATSLPSAPTQPSESGFVDALQAALLLVPALVLAWPGPGAILRGDVIPQATGAGIAALCTLPAALFLLVRGATPSVRGLGLFLLPLLVAVGWVSLDRTTDTFEMSRVLLTLFTGLACLLTGASLRASGKRLLMYGTMVIASLVVAGALLDSDPTFSGVLGNTGSISEAAVPGAAIGLALAVRGRGLSRWIGAALFALVLVYTARVPVLAGSLALLAVAVFMLMRGAARVPGLALVVLAIAALVGPIVVHRLSTGPSASTLSASTATRDPGPTGGFEVRERVWKSSLRMLAAHPLAGVGPGQFAACFPAFRDPLEIELSTHQRRAGVETEVEHPHNDWLYPALEGGSIAGLAWLAFLGLVLVQAWRSSKQPDFADSALAAAALGIAVNAFVRAPLFSNPTSSTLAFAIFGALLAREEVEAGRVGRRIVVFGAVLLLGVGTLRLRALDFVRHGLALQEYATANAAGSNPEKVSRAVADAIAACPESVVARSLSARLSEASKDGPAVVAAEWARVLDLRPLRVDALMQLGQLHALAGEYGEARSRFESALALDPNHPGLIRNMATVEINTGHLEIGLALLDRLQGDRAPSLEWLTGFSARLALRGLVHEAEAVIARADPTLARKSAEECWTLAKAARKAGQDEIADGWEARAHLQWARDHAGNARWTEAVRSYRQALRVCTIHVSSPPRVRLELAAALLMSGREDEAREQAKGLAPAPQDWSALPAWAVKALRDAHVAEDTK